MFFPPQKFEILIDLQKNPLDANLLGSQLAVWIRCMLFSRCQSHALTLVNVVYPPLKANSICTCSFIFRLSFGKNLEHSAKYNYIDLDVI
jgi:hypothetical protein